MISPTAIDAVLQHFLPAIRAHKAKSATPYILGLSGLQGSGKSTWAGALTTVLTSDHKLNTRTLSLDDLYHDHPELVAVREANPHNKLLRTRGQPGTHDEELAREFFDGILSDAASGDTIKWPAFDKSLYNGEGGRVPTSEWEVVPRNPPLDVVIFEGWCLGFQPLSPEGVKAKWEAAGRSQSTDTTVTLSTETLADHSLEDLLVVNSNLDRYCKQFMGPWRFDGFLHLSTDELANVYRWRLDQEKALWKAKGRGMSDEQVISFVRGYMPAYELYLEGLSQPFFGPAKATDEGRKIHVRVILDQQREVLSTKEVL